MGWLTEVVLESLPTSQKVASRNQKVGGQSGRRLASQYHYLIDSMAETLCNVREINRCQSMKHGHLAVDVCFSDQAGISTILQYSGGCLLVSSSLA